MIFTSQNPKIIPIILRNNIDFILLYKFADTQMVLEKLYDGIEEEFVAVYKYSTSEPQVCSYIDTHPTTQNDKTKAIKSNSIKYFNP